MSFKACRRVALAVLIISIACLLILVVVVTRDTYWVYGALTLLGGLVGFGIHCVWEVVFPDPAVKQLMKELEDDAELIEDDEDDPPDEEGR